MRKRKNVYYKKVKVGEIVHIRGKIRGSLVGYTILEGEGKLEEEEGGGGGGEVGEKRGAIRIVDECNVAEGNVLVDVGRCR